jgi:hypothetical protein
LKTDFIPHKIIPVSSYSDLKEANTELVQTDDEVLYSASSSGQHSPEFRVTFSVPNCIPTLSCEPLS